MAHTKPLVEQIVDDVTRLIERGALSPDARLQSIRSMAADYGVSKNTIVEVFDRLVATGYVYARRGAGFYVARVSPHSASGPPQHFAQAINLVSLLREQLNQSYEVRAGDGRLPASWMEISDLGKQLNRGWKHSSDAADDFEYGRPQGYTPLRETLARKLLDRAIPVAPEQILLTFGANHALDLIVRHFVDPGDPVLVETPGYYPLFGKLRLQKARIVGIPRGPAGLDLECLENQAREHRAKLLFVQPMAHNPTGCSMTLSEMHRLLRVAERLDLTVIEDDPFADILPRGTPHLASLDALQRVIYVGTFSKTLSASLRCGFIAANSSVVSSLTDLKMLTVVNSAGSTERVIHNLISRGSYRRHLSRLRDRVTQSGAEALAKLRETGIEGIEPPGGGYYIWCPLPDHIDDVDLARRASSSGIFLAPGSLFRHTDSQGAPALRLNIAYAGDPKLIDFLRGHIVG